MASTSPWPWRQWLPVWLVALVIGRDLLIVGGVALIRAAASGVPTQAAVDRQDQHASPRSFWQLARSGMLVAGPTWMRGRGPDRRRGAHHAAVRRRVCGAGDARSIRSGLLEARRRLALIGLAPLFVLLICLYLFRPSCCPSWSAWPGPICSIRRQTGCNALGLRRTSATIVISVGFFLVRWCSCWCCCLPILLTQAAELARALPDYLEGLRERLLPRLSGIASWASSRAGRLRRGLLKQYWTQAMDVLINAIAGLLQSGVALLNIVSLLFITPVVTFYMLRDWDRMVARVAGHVPPDYMPSVLRLAHEIDEVLAGFIRGQGMVCLFLALFYASGLWLVGLRYGLIIGLLTGVLLVHSLPRHGDRRLRRPRRRRVPVPGSGQDRLWSPASSRSASSSRAT